MHGARPAVHLTSDPELPRRQLVPAERELAQENRAPGADSDQWTVRGSSQKTAAPLASVSSSTSMGGVPPRLRRRTRISATGFAARLHHSEKQWRERERDGSSSFGKIGASPVTAPCPNASRHASTAGTLSGVTCSHPILSFSARQWTELANGVSLSEMSDHRSSLIPLARWPVSFASVSASLNRG